MFRFLTTRSFFLNLVVLIALVTGLIFGILGLLSMITKHGDYLTVPNIIYRNTNEAIKELEKRGFDVQITDSVYVDSLKRGIVIKQFPDPNSSVKVNRTVLLTVNRVTVPLVDMPPLKGKSLGYALELIKRGHLILGDTTFKPDFMMGSVLEQKFNGTEIQPGAKLPWGSKVDLVIGAGLQNQRIPVPDLVGMRYSEAKLILEQHGIMLAGVVPTGALTDTASAFVWKQSPEPTTPLLEGGKQVNYIQGGQLMDLWISQIMIANIDSTSKPK